MQPRLPFHPRPLMILLAIVLCLIATSAFAQRRSIGPSTGPSTSTGVINQSTPSASGLTSGTAPGITAGMPSPSGLTSGSTALPPGAPVPSGLTSGTNGAALGVTDTSPRGDATAIGTGGSTRGVVVLPADPNAQPTGALAAGNATAISGAGAAGMTGGTPSVAPMRIIQNGALTATQMAQLFAQADVDADGQLTRAEALRLQVVTMSFDDMDTNRDGTVSRSEYESSLR